MTPGLQAEVSNGGDVGSWGGRGVWGWPHSQLSLPCSATGAPGARGMCGWHRDFVNKGVFL